MSTLLISVFFAVASVGCSAPHDMPAIEYLTAHQQISDFIVVATRHNDILDKDAHYATMTEDCEVHMPLSDKALTREEFVNLVNKGTLNTFQMAHHTLSNPLINFENATHAGSVCYFQAHHFTVAPETGTAQDAVVYGRYMQKWRKCTDGFFRIYHHRVHFDHYDNMASEEMKKTREHADGVLLENLFVVHNKRDKSDLSYRYLGEAAYGHTRQSGYYFEAGKSKTLNLMPITVGVLAVVVTALLSRLLKFAFI